MAFTHVSTDLSGYALQVNHTNGTWFQISLAQSPPSEIDGDAAVQSLVDYLADWSDLDGSVTARKLEQSVYDVTPTP